MIFSNNLLDFKSLTENVKHVAIIREITGAIASMYNLIEIQHLKRI